MRAALLCLALAACTETSILDFGLAFPRGQTRLPEGTASVRLRLEATGKEVSAPVDADGRFSLALEQDTTGVVAPATLDALDAAGQLLAHGVTPPLPLGGVDDHLVFFMSAPGELVTLPTAYDHDNLGVAALALPYGILLAGGVEGEDASADVRVYNAYSHAFQVGDPLPEGRSFMAALPRSDGRVLLVGGRDPAEAWRGQVWLYNPNAPPAGHTIVLGEDERIAREAPHLAPLPDGRVLVVGGGRAPAIIDANVDDQLLGVSVPADPPAAALAATMAIARQDGSVFLFGPQGAALLASGAYSTLELVADAEAAGFLAADGTVWLVSRDAVGLAPDGSVRTVSDLLPPPSVGEPFMTATLSGDRLLVTTRDQAYLVTVTGTLTFEHAVGMPRSSFTPSVAVMPTGAFFLAPGGLRTPDLQLVQL